MSGVLSWRTLPALAMIGMAFATAFAAEGALPQEAQEVLAKGEAVQSYQTRFTLEAKEEGVEPVRLEGTLLFQRPNRRRLELREEGEKEASQLLVSDGVTEWQSYPAANTVYRLRSVEETPGPHRPFSETKEGSVRFVQRVESGMEKRFRFEATPLPSVVEGSPVPIQTLRVDVGEQDGLVRELILLDAQGEPVLTQRYTDLKVDIPVEKEVFSFVPPEGFQVVDLDKPD